MAERHAMRPRTCQVCGETTERTAAQVKRHAVECEAVKRAEDAARRRRVSQ